MFVYHYHPETFLFLRKSQAKIDPLETKRTGIKIYLKPRFSTFVKPSQELGVLPKWNGDSWENIIDKRGQKYFLKGDLKPKVITKVGEDFPQGYLIEADPNDVQANNLKIYTEERYRLRKSLQNKLEVESLGKIWDFSLESISLFNGMITLGNPFQWRPKGETYTNLTIKEALQIGMAIKVKLGQIDAASEKDKAAIKAGDYSNINLKTLIGA